MAALRRFAALIGLSASACLALAQGRAQPVAVHFDIEPHATMAWREGRPVQDAMIGQTVDLLEKLNALWNANGRTMTFIWDMPNSRYLRKQLFDAGPDQINVMNFVDHEDGQRSRVQWEIDYAKKSGKKLSIAVETQDVEGDVVTFWEEGPQYMQNMLVRLDRHWRTNYPDTWRGFEVHDYIWWRKMQPSVGYEYVDDRIDASIYLWQWWFALPGYEAERAEFWQFLQQQPYVFKKIAFQSHELLYHHQHALQDFINDAAARGYAVDLAMGESEHMFPQFHDFTCELAQIAFNFHKYGPLNDPYDPPAGAIRPVRAAERPRHVYEPPPPESGSTLSPTQTGAPTTASPTTAAPTTAAPTTAAPTDSAVPTQGGTSGEPTALPTVAPSQQTTDVPSAGPTSGNSPAPTRPAEQDNGSTSVRNLASVLLGVVAGVLLAVTLAAPVLPQ